MPGVSKTKKDLYVWPERDWTAGETEKYDRKIIVMAAPTRKHQMSTDKHMRVTVTAWWGELWVLWRMKK